MKVELHTVTKNSIINLHHCNLKVLERPKKGKITAIVLKGTYKQKKSRDKYVYKKEGETVLLERNKRVYLLIPGKKKHEKPYSIEEGIVPSEGGEPFHTPKHLKSEIESPNE